MRRLKGESILITVIAAILCWGCSTKKSIDQPKLTQEIISVEQQFNDYAAQHGVKEAFLEFAADSAALNRGGKIIKGKKAISTYFDNQPFSKVSLSWKPAFVNVSKDGSMAYTYGPFTFSAKDSLNNPVEAQGIFHTVWERQQDGSWKYVYD